MKSVTVITLMTMAALLLAAAAQAQYTNIRISPEGDIDPEEVTIAINPADPFNLAAGANLNYYYYSKDRGRTWTRGRLTSSLGVHGDPCVIFNALGDLYYGHLSNPRTYQGSWLDRIVVQRSESSGVEWDDGVGVGLNGSKDQDKEWLAADITDSPYRHNIYMAWTQFDRYGSREAEDSSRIMFARTTDNGKTWSASRVISDQGGNCLDDDYTVEGAVPAVGPDGEVYIAWSGPLGLMFDRSFDGGVSFGADIFIASQYGGWNQYVPGIYRCNGLPVTACDISDSPYRGTVYVLWSDFRNGHPDIFISKSTDRGDTWSSPVMVNDDDGAAYQFFPWLCVDPVTGAVYIIFYDRRNTAGSATEVYMAASYDGGGTFKNVKISESAFMPSSDIFFGDYINIAAFDGYVHPIWMRMDQGNLSVWTAAIYDTAAFTHVAAAAKTESFALRQNYPNPFNPSTVIPFTLKRSGQVSLSMIDVQGRTVDVVYSGYVKAGAHEMVWNSAGRGAGIYFYRLESDGAVKVRKCVLLK